MHNRNIKTVLVFTMLVFFGFTSGSQAAGLFGGKNEKLTEAVYAYFHAGNQIAAVDNDARIYLRWMFDNKDIMRDGSQELLKWVAQIKGFILSVPLPPELVKLKQRMLGLLDYLATIYKNMDQKTAQEIEEEYRLFKKYYTGLQEDLQEYLQQVINFEELPDQKQQTRIEADLLKGLEDKQKYLNAVKQFENRKIGYAYNLFKDLGDKYEDLPGSDVLMVRMSDCLNWQENLLPIGVDQRKAALDLLTEVVNGHKYSPILYHAYYRWRTSYQYYYHGMEHTAEIPNWEYNDVRYALIKLINNHIQDNPDDKWAQFQVVGLLSMDVITRDCEIGNCNTIYWASLYSDVFDEVEEENDNLVNVKE